MYPIPQTLALLDRFKSKLSNAITDTAEEEKPVDELEEDEDKGWWVTPLVAASHRTSVMNTSDNAVLSPH